MDMGFRSDWGGDDRVLSYPAARSRGPTVNSILVSGFSRSRNDIDNRTVGPRRVVLGDGEGDKRPHPVVAGRGRSGSQNHICLSQFIYGEIWEQI
jgi:hypothetical protein